jgi:hypothetical protein
VGGNYVSAITFVPPVTYLPIGVTVDPPALLPLFANPGQTRSNIMRKHIAVAIAAVVATLGISAVEVAAVPSPAHADLNPCC